MGQKLQIPKIWSDQKINHESNDQWVTRIAPLGHIWQCCLFSLVIRVTSANWQGLHTVVYNLKNSTRPRICWIPAIFWVGCALHSLIIFRFKESRNGLNEVKNNTCFESVKFSYIKNVQIWPFLPRTKYSRIFKCSEEVKIAYCKSVKFDKFCTAPKNWYVWNATCIDVKGSYIYRIIANCTVIWI